MPMTTRILIQRIGYGALAIAFLVVLFELDAVVADRVQGDDAFSQLLQRGSLVPIFVLAVTLSGAVELTRLFRAGGARPHARFAYLMTAIVVLAPWFSAAGWLGKNPRAVEGLYWSLVLVMIAVPAAGCLTVFRGETQGAVRDTGATVFIVLYLGFLTSFALQLRCGADTPAREGVWLLLIAVLVTKCSDIGAFFAGSTFGRHRLAPHISPGKSIEGAMGGVLGSVFAAVMFVSAGSITAALDAPFSVRAITDVLTRAFSVQTTAHSLSPILRAIIFGLVLSVMGQLGDLFESCLKRDAGVKDSGNVIPRYGGVLDLIDSPVFTLPTAWFLLTGVWNLP